ncbi:methylmalonate-semialdehyde dehydrogenase (acylating) [Vibrio zhanjiangensis]|uniref:methylmalonate-semialdehyde dehydrogenase (CoA acylating) n=1 Tax=Vibrio zhanjiangensis TaxID=1046128 RepID=A0ABQ6EVG4_9VIBR|nr:CoA-acylating methylmalonate-semialdehyde dehydrogenase [Vibrio zhanjiangensis]GLT16691.1 methylmalonate-semialdehyde dehydrogenase (acylating) [Vibrio zhanjiangensis]
MSEYIGHLINGEIHSDKSQTQAVYNPATGAVCANVCMASQETVAMAISSAKQAYPAWRNTPPAMRAQVMYRFKQRLEENQDIICELISREHGKVLSDAKGELARGIENVEFACGIPELLKGEHSRNVGRDIDAWSELQPLGVVAGITPFNFPAMVPLWMWPSAIMCGNTFVLKPSERDPSCVLYIAKLAEEAGLPKGVLNVIHGGADVVNQLIDDDTIQAVSFVGSTPIAETIYKRASEKGKRCQALGGAKNHAVIMPDADLDNVANALMGAAYGSCGQRCMAISVAVAIGDKVADALIDKLKPQVEALKVGPGSDDRNEMGPLITSAQRDKVSQFVAQAIEQGAEVIVDGRELVIAGHESGFFIGGTLFDKVTPDMDIYQQEVFGPVLVVVRVDSLEEAVALINRHEYGNGTCIFTRDGQASRYFSDQVMVGMVGINVPLPVPVSYHSFGGWKRSLFGDLHAYGPDSVRFYTRRKAISQRWPSGEVKDGTLFSFPSL